MRATPLAVIAAKKRDFAVYRTEPCSISRLIAWTSHLMDDLFLRPPGPDMPPLVR